MDLLSARRRSLRLLLSLAVLAVMLFIASTDPTADIEPCTRSDQSKSSLSPQALDGFKNTRCHKNDDELQDQQRFLENDEKPAGREGATKELGSVICGDNEKDCHDYFDWAASFDMVGAIEKGPKLSEEDLSRVTEQAIELIRKVADHVSDTKGDEGNMLLFRASNFSLLTYPFRRYQEPTVLGRLF